VIRPAGHRPAGARVSGDAVLDDGRHIFDTNTPAATDLEIIIDKDSGMAFETNRRSFTAATLLGVGALAGGPLTAQATGSGAATAASGASGGAVPLAPPNRQPAKRKVPEPVARKAGWAIVGLGQLALEEVMPAFGECKLSRPAALVSGHPDKAKQVAEVYGVDAKAIYDYAGFDRLADNRDVDAVYIILPNSMHAESAR
jgi:hypothetical protein